MSAPLGPLTAQTVEARAPIVAAKKSLLAQWKEQASAMRAAAPRGKLGEQVNVMYAEIDGFLDWVANLGGEHAAELFICAKIYKRATLESVAGEYMLHPGMMWAFITETPERFEHYRRAQAGVADALLSAVPAILDGEEKAVRDERGRVVLDDEGRPLTAPTDLKERKVRGDGYLKVAAMMHPERFGTREQAASPGTGNVIDAALNFAAAELLNRIARPAERVVSEQ